ncbi:MAG: LytTR family DNA-binding domain-containing protein [Christensenellaceae bacterium]
MNFTVAIVEDQLSDQQVLSQYLEQYRTHHQISIQIQIFSSGEDFLKNFTNGAFDIVFLDIYMNGMDGMKVAKSLREIDEDCILIFSTTSENHAVQSYRVRAFDYLLKPYTYQQFFEVLTLCSAVLQKKAHYIEVKAGRIMLKILLKDIIYVDYYNHYIQIHTPNRIIKTYMPFADFSKMLSAYPQFLCCYRNCIVNMDEVNEIHEKDFCMKNNEMVPIAGANKTEIKQCYANYIFDRLNSTL